MKFPINVQRDSFDCGPTCLQMVCQYYGKKIDINFLREHSYITKQGVSLLGLNEAAEEIGFRTILAKTETTTLVDDDFPLPAIIHWNQDHFIVLYQIKSIKNKESKYIIADPGYNTLQELTKRDFERGWLGEENNKGLILLLEPTARFYSNTYPLENQSLFFDLLRYILPFKNGFLKLALFVLLSTAFALTFPFLTQVLLDNGVLKKNENYVIATILLQVLFFILGFVVDLIKAHILLSINIKISLSIVSSFLKKMLSLPIKFFDTKTMGDLTQRIRDHQRIKVFLTGDLVNTIFSTIQIIIFTAILFYYSLKVGLTFIFLSSIAILWIFLYQKKRKKLDYIMFNQNKNVQDKLSELIFGIHEIKLYGSENFKRWDWEIIQNKINNLSLKSLTLEQYQQSGFRFFSFFKNIVIFYIVSIAVIDNKLSVGVMLSVSYILGQVNGPLEVLLSFFKSSQDAKLSMDRLNEIQNKKDEEKEYFENPECISGIPACGDLKLENISFQFQGKKSPLVLDSVSLYLKEGTTTAIVGESGSGKTTLLKLILGIYKPTFGEISLSDIKLNNISPKMWREKCGTVMQDGYIFSDTVERNIALDGREIDKEKLEKAIFISNLNEYISKLPLGVKTRIGSNGVGLSGGQRQRILIARAVYKNPEYLLFDEATSSLDANNEKVIISNLKEFFKGKTVIVVAHRLSTVKHADQIIVLERGMVSEVGNHESLIQKKGKYFELVKNQLELGN